MQEPSSSSDVWSQYWESAKGAAGCLPDGGPELAATIGALWRDFAQPLPVGAEVVDLCCGNGSAGRALLGANRRLSLTGIDAAQLPNDSKPPFRIVTGASIEAMPFEDGRFEAAISQFGIEYAGPETAAGEIARIVKPDGRICFLMHHAEGAVVAAGRKRAAMLGALSGEEIWRAAERREPGRLQTQFDPIVAHWGQEEVILQIANAIREALPMDDGRRKRRLDELQALIRLDRTLVGGLIDVALDGNRIAAWEERLGQWFDLDEPRTAEHGGTVIGWLLGGTRR